MIMITAVYRGWRFCEHNLFSLSKQRANSVSLMHFLHLSTWLSGARVTAFYNGSNQYINFKRINPPLIPPSFTYGRQKDAQQIRGMQPNTNVYAHLGTPFNTPPPPPKPLLAILGNQVNCFATKYYNIWPNPRVDNSYYQSAVGRDPSPPERNRTVSLKKLVNHTALPTAIFPH